MNKGEVPKVAKFYIDFFVEYANSDHNTIPLQLSRCNDPVWIEAGKCFKILNSKFCNFQSYTFVQLISQNSLNLSRTESKEVPKWAEQISVFAAYISFLIESWFLNENAQPFTGSILYWSSLFLFPATGKKKQLTFSQSDSFSN